MFSLYTRGASEKQIRRGVRTGEALIAAYGLSPEFVYAAAMAKEDGRAHDETAAQVWLEADRIAFQAGFQPPPPPRRWRLAGAFAGRACDCVPLAFACRGTKPCRCTTSTPPAWSATSGCGAP